MARPPFTPSAPGSASGNAPGSASGNAPAQPASEPAAATPPGNPGAGRPAASSRAEAGFPGRPAPTATSEAGTIIASYGDHERWDAFSLGDVEAVRMLIEGGSVIDWPRLHFSTLSEVERFLRVQEFHPEEVGDQERMEELRVRALDYLQDSLHLRIGDPMLMEVPVPELLLVASTATGPRQTQACVLLKVMHVLHHLEGRELLFKLPVSDDQIFHLVEAKVFQVVEALRADGHTVVEFAWSRKDPNSLVTKLLAKKQSIAAHVYDKLRFRLVVRHEHDLVPVLRALHHRLIPFNYVIPGESVNQIVRLSDLLGEDGPLHRFFGRIDLSQSLPASPKARALAQPSPSVAEQPNEFSGPGFRVLNFIVDLPVRMDSLFDALPKESRAAYEPFGRIVFVLAEFQLMDEQTAVANERGENAHSRYKSRQHQRVKVRLTGTPSGTFAADPGPSHQLHKLGEDARPTEARGVVDLALEGGRPGETVVRGGRLEGPSTGFAGPAAGASSPRQIDTLPDLSIASGAPGARSAPGAAEAPEGPRIDPGVDRQMDPRPDPKEES